MKRDMELIRRMILLIEDDPRGYAPPDISIEGYTPDQIGYHAYLIVDSGLADGYDSSDVEDSGPSCGINYLTSAGHDFADSARTQFIWDDVLGDMRAKGIASVTVERLKKLLDKKIRKVLVVRQS